MQEQFVAWMDDPVMEAFLSKSFAERPRGKALFEAFLNVSARTDSQQRVWAIELPSGQLVGHIEAKRTSKTDDGQLELIYAIRAEMVGRGIATEAVLQIANSLEANGIGVVAYIGPANSSSRRVLQKAKFLRTFRGHISHGEEWTR